MEFGIRLPRPYKVSVEVDLNTLDQDEYHGNFIGWNAQVKIHV